MNRPTMTRMIFALSLGFGGVILATQIAFANPQCGSREALTALLADRYGETRRAMGVAGADAVMELYASGATGTWTITMTLADGRMCLMASGLGYEALTDDLPAKGERI
ncbi:hypothetical protein [Tabrizicola sp.]|uniref:hypothetical protein n=1 Tax=Tabrizicola sp. TaxID=2005166 RepID=UPI0026283497|nr:hypothetical protein [Tabrizicola sp.]MDM7932946.1 hypothetical protein [Tabrizicola sp.]